jgi:hypothetical protein
MLVKLSYFVRYIFSRKIVSPREHFFDFVIFLFIN